jgi:glycerate kinase
MVSGDLSELYQQGLTSAFTIGNQPMSLNDSKARAASLLSSTSEQLLRLLSGLEKTGEPENTTD